MHIGKFALGGALLASALIAHPATATTFVSGGVAARASYRLGTSQGSDPQSANLVAPGSIAVSSLAGYNIGGSRPTISVHSSVDATWGSADAGSVDVAWGWFVDTINTPLFNQVYTYASPLREWSYSFVASGDGVFTLDYSLLAAGSSSFGLWGYTGSGGLGNARLPSNATTASGKLVVPLIAGQTYNLGLSNDGFSSSEAANYNVRSAIGRFDWAITYNDAAPVPEPAGWVMMIGGMGLVGAALRRRGGLAPLPA